MDQSFLMLFDFISVAAGAYILYTLFKLNAYGRLFPSSLLIPSGKQPKDCDDAEGYIRYVKPRLLVLGIFLLAFGLVSLANESLQFLPFVASMVCNAVTLLVIIWYGICSYKAFRLYW